MSTRRTFMKQAGVAGAAALLLPSFACGTARKPVGLQLYTLRDQLPKDVKGVIARVGAAGYKEVETYGFDLKTGFWGMPAKDFKTLLRDNGLHAASGHMGVDSFIETGNTDELKANIEAMKTLGASYVTVAWLGEQVRKSADDYKKISEKFNQAGEMAKASGLGLAYHNHDFEFHKHGDTTGYEIMLKNTDPKLVKFELDLYWAVRSGNHPTKLFGAHPGRFVMWHVKDMDKLKPENNTEIGNGDIDFKEIFAKARQSGLEHFFVEQESNYRPNELDSIKVSFDYINKNLI
ncbi:sugar phosphate isomerase/epimerase [Pedobacter yulinensis]|uniref:Sugar phosphate isomerase/epimerase n=1 Tax=Pedobacter yulinensis TaxID=2126353 RepID=A0A2T3HPQ4_9SPHI|nr:sugar phosphate isomerase/epimerase [Pedobacter yulinensis]PST84409.1 sugar phosphate isomerase/epimerase [Pedobacter yulinensis]